MWSPWRLDPFTWAWIGWIAVFVVVETWALTQGYRGTLTAHLRPIFAAHPLTYAMAIGLWLWVGLHFLAWPVEQALSRWLAAGFDQLGG